MIDQSASVSLSGKKPANARYGISFVARRNTNDIRRLIGDINQIFFFAANNLPKYSVVDLNTVRSILAPSNQEEINLFGYDMDPNIIIEQVCNSYGVKVDMVKSKSKLKLSQSKNHLPFYRGGFSWYNIPMPKIKFTIIYNTKSIYKIEPICYIYLKKGNE